MNSLFINFYFILGIFMKAKLIISFVKIFIKYMKLEMHKKKAVYVLTLFFNKLKVIFEKLNLKFIFINKILYKNCKNY